MYRPTRPAFTLTEVIVVIAIIAVLMSLILPAIMMVRSAADRLTCGNNMRQMGIGIKTYAASKNNQVTPDGISGLGHATWLVLLAPYVGEDNFYNQWDLKKTYYLQTAGAQQTNIRLYHCPARREPGMLSKDGDPGPWLSNVSHMPGGLADYAACGGSEVSHAIGHLDSNGQYIFDGVMLPSTAHVPFTQWPSGIYTEFTGWQSRIKFTEIPDGTSSTFMFGEKHVGERNHGSLAAGGDGSAYNTGSGSTRVAGGSYVIAQSPKAPYNVNFGSNHPRGVCQFIFADGSLHGLGPSTDPLVLSRLASRFDGQIIPPYVDE